MRILDLLRALGARLHALGARLRARVSGLGSGRGRARLRALIAGLGPGRPALLPAGGDPGDLDIDLDDGGPVARVAAPAAAVHPSAVAGPEARVAREPAAPIHRRRPPTRASLRAPAGPGPAPAPAPQVAAPAPRVAAPRVAAAPPTLAAHALVAVPAPAATAESALVPESAPPVVAAPPTVGPAPAPAVAATAPAVAAPAPATPARGRLRLVADARRTPAPIDAAIGAIPVRRFFARISATRAPAAAPTPWPAATVERFFTTLVAPRLDLNPTRAACIDAPRSVDEALGDFIWE